MYYMIALYYIYSIRLYYCIIKLCDHIDVLYYYVTYFTKKLLLHCHIIMFFYYNSMIP